MCLFCIFISFPSGSELESSKITYFGALYAKPGFGSGQVNPCSRLCSTGFDQDNVAILHHVVLALGHHLPGSFDGRFVSQLSQCLIVEDDALDKGLFEIWSGLFSEMIGEGKGGDEPVWMTPAA